MLPIEIQRQTQILPDGNTLPVFVVPAMAIHTPNGKTLIPNPNGLDAAVFETLEDAAQAVFRAGFDYQFEGQTYTQQSNRGRRSILPAAQTVRPQALQNIIPLLIERLNDKEPGVLANTVYALGELKVTESVLGMITLLGHDDGTLRQTLAAALAKLAPHSVTPLLKAYASTQQVGYDRNVTHTRLTILTAFSEMLKRGHHDITEKILPQLQDALSDKNWLVRAQAALTLADTAAYFEQLQAQ